MLEKFKNPLSTKRTKISDDAPTYSALHNMEKSPNKNLERASYKANLIKVQARDFRTALKLINFIPTIMDKVSINSSNEDLTNLIIGFEKILRIHAFMTNLGQRITDNKNFLYLVDTLGNKQPLEDRINEIINKITGIIVNKGENPITRETRIKILKLLLEKTVNECRNLLKL